MTRKRFLISLICVVLFSPLAAETCLSQSAWQELVRKNPSVVDDRSIDWQQRLILNVLTLEQARRYYEGASPNDFLVDEGQTLAEYLAARLNPPGNVFVPLPGPCELFGVEALLPGESLSVQVRGLCGIPEEARAVILQVKVESAGMYPRVKLWATDLPEPAEAVIEGSNASFDDLKAMTAVVTLCAVDGCQGGELQIKGTDAGMVQAEVVGYFRPLGAADGIGPGSGIQFYTESGDNNFFGDGAGAANTTGASNAFFGGSAGASNTTGSDNTFFGTEAGFSNTEGSFNAFLGDGSGYSNTTGFENTFFGAETGYSNTTGYYNVFLGDLAGFDNTVGFSNVFVGGVAGSYNTTGSANTIVGDEAGASNTVENYNTFLGNLADLDPGLDPGTDPVTNATALGHRAYVSQSNSLVLGSINGVNGATASTQVGIGTTAPERLLHIAGNNAVFRMDRSTNSAAFMIIRTNSSGDVLKNFVVGVDASGVNQGEFVINDLGTALGGPGERRLTINNDGDVIINGDLIANAGPLSFPDYVFAKDYNLMPLGELQEYIETEKHLPELPSAEEIEAQGEINMTELQLKLLQKIEELTLYTIQQQTTIDRLTARLEVLEQTDSLDR